MNSRILYCIWNKFAIFSTQHFNKKNSIRFLCTRIPCCCSRRECDFIVVNNSDNTRQFAVTEFELSKCTLTPSFYAFLKSYCKKCIQNESWSYRLYFIWELQLSLCRHMNGIICCCTHRSKWREASERRSERKRGRRSSK